MNTKHTPGPWNIDACGNVWSKDTKVCGMSEQPKQADDYRVKSDEEHKANTRLIAAAPELLELARKLILLCPSSEGLGGHAPIKAFIQLGEEAREVIKKAISP